MILLMLKILLQRTNGKKFAVELVKKVENTVHL